MDKLKMWCNYQQHSYYIHYSSHFINLKIAVAVPLTWMHPPSQKGLREHSITSAEIRTFELSPWLFWHLGIFPLLTIIQYIYIYMIHPWCFSRPANPEPFDSSAPCATKAATGLGYRKLIAQVRASCRSWVVRVLGDGSWAWWVSKLLITWKSSIYSYGHLLVITGYFYGIIHSINGVISTYNW